MRTQLGEPWRSEFFREVPESLSGSKTSENNKWYIYLKFSEKLDQFSGFQNCCYWSVFTCLQFFPWSQFSKEKEEQRGRQMYTRMNTRLCQEGRRARNGHLENALLYGIQTHIIFKKLKIDKSEWFECKSVWLLSPHWLYHISVCQAFKSLYKIYKGLMREWSGKEIKGSIHQ